MVGVPLWTLSRAAHIASLGESILTLLTSGKLSGCKLITRSMLDGMVDILYLNSHSISESDLFEFFGMETAEDRYADLKFELLRRNWSEQEVRQKDPECKRIIDEYKRVQAHPLTQAGSKGIRGKVRWRFISSGIKFKAANEKVARALKPLEHTIRELGNAQAHHRPSELNRFMVQVEPDKVSVRTKSREQPKDRYSPEWLAFEANLCLIITADQLNDIFDLSPSFAPRVQKLHDELKALLKRRNDRQNATI